MFLLSHVSILISDYDIQEQLVLLLGENPANSYDESYTIGQRNGILKITEELK